MLLVCGEALFDMYAEQTATGLRFEAFVGGSPFNVSVGLARLGCRSALLTGVSHDFLGARLRATLAAEGVETGYLVAKDAPTTLAFVSAGADGGPDYAFYGAGAADRSLTEADLPGDCDGVWGVHAGSFSLLTEPTGFALLTLFRREKGRRLLSLDPNVRLNVEPDREAWRARVDAFAACADLVKISWEDAEALYPGATPEALAARWFAMGVRLTVVTFGADGAVAYTDRERARSPGHPIAPGARDADTVGAGDTFQAALLAALRKGDVRDPGGLDADRLAAILDFAARAAAVTCSRRGADMPYRSELAGAS